MKPPVEEDQVLEDLEITAIGKQGDGIGKVQGYTLIVQEKGLERGDRVNVRVARVLDKYGFAEVINDGRD